MPINASSPWDDKAPIRAELFSTERLEQHAESLAAAQPVTMAPKAVLSLITRLADNASTLLSAYRSSATALETGVPVTPAAEWLLDNYHVVEAQIWEIRTDLPPSYYRQLPKLADGPLIGHPRVFGIAWAYVAHTDSRFDPDTWLSFLRAYQRVQPLTIGELWAVAITLRIVLVENLRRLADQIIEARELRTRADEIADHVLGIGDTKITSLSETFGALEQHSMRDMAVEQLAKRFRDQDPAVLSTQSWLEDRLRYLNTSMEDSVRQAQQMQGATNVTVQNIVTSMRLISDTDWSEMFESVSLVDEHLRAYDLYGGMDFSTRNLYRSAIEELARGSGKSEIDIAERAVSLAEVKRDPANEARVQDPGFYLIGKGRRALETDVGFRPPFWSRLFRITVNLGLTGYVGSILLMTALLLGLMLLGTWRPGPDSWAFVLLAIFGLFPAMDTAIALVNLAISRVFKADLLPALDFKEGIPTEYRTIVVVPTLLLNERDVLEQVEQLEVHYLASPSASGEVYFAMLSDWPDADVEKRDGDDELLAVAVKAVARLNERHGSGPNGDRFLVLHRRRLFNLSENCWMGWERKRGKLEELNRLLRGATETTFISIDGKAPTVPSDVRYVITLDSDTRLPMGSVSRMVGKMAHPLNRTRFNETSQRVVDGYGIMQPRVTPSLPTIGESSLYQTIFSTPGGVDPYAAAVSDVYQDLFGEGSFTGKGIYDVEAFEASLENRVPENRLLSHDLFEGVFARASFVSDIEVVEEFPARYDVASKRQHRWVRGDWQLLPWILGFVKGGRGSISRLGRWKMIDNLRRSLVAPMTLMALAVAWFMPVRIAFHWTVFILAAIAIPAFFPLLFSILPRRSGISRRSHFRALGTDSSLAFMQVVLQVMFMVDQAYMMGDAIVRTLYRLTISRKNLLEWVTSAQVGTTPRLTLAGYYRRMSISVLFAALIGGALVAFSAPALFIAAPFVLLWLLAPVAALWISWTPESVEQLAVSEDTTRALRLTARRTWRFFETFVTPNENMLPPDNFQEDPEPVVAHRTSPTNIGLFLLSSVTARDFGWSGTVRTLERLEQTLETVNKLEKFRGHLLNWYYTQTLAVLQPAYVSSVDSGNFAGHLITLANACNELRRKPVADAATVWAGLSDTVNLAIKALRVVPTFGHVRWLGLASDLAAILEEMENAAIQGVRDAEEADGSKEIDFSALRKQMANAEELVDELSQEIGEAVSSDLRFWTQAISRLIDEHSHDRVYAADHGANLRARFDHVADTARAMAVAMEFDFLLDKHRKLLSIGYSVAQNVLDNSCYDLLASEARLASMFAIAKGDAPPRHWFRLGRSATPIGRGAALISWSGSMFEYLMPTLVMREPTGSLLQRTNYLVVKHQQAYGRNLGIPWGVSESAYNARDIEFTYQYSNFGVPGLGLKRGLAENVVIAPYATGLASMIDPKASVENYARLAKLGARGRYGFYEAVDFTRSRLPEGKECEVVRNYMAHHQGMTVVAIANILQNGKMRARFHAEPMIQASELLLQERIPRDVAISHPKAEELKISAADLRGETPTVRRYGIPNELSPVVHALSNGVYSVLLTSGGSGLSGWHDTSVTRWRQDAARDDWGTYIFLKDAESGDVWSAGYQPTAANPDHYEAVFSEDRAEFIRRDGSITTTMEVVVSAENDAEVRRISIANSGRKARRIDVTSYAEIVLATVGADIAHPAFSKMFVQTEYLPEQGVIIATRRPRSAGEQTLWAAHLAVIEGKTIGEAEVETDRARFIGRGRNIREAAAIHDGKPLSNTVGTVLDPIFSLRRRVEIPAGRSVRLAFWTMVAPSREELLDLIDKHKDSAAFERATTLAWTQAQVQLRHLGMDYREVAEFQRLAGFVLFADPRLRPAPELIRQGATNQAMLWPFGISGDFPIIAVRIDDVEDMALIRQLLQAQEYWRLKGLAFDLVIMNERSASYVQDLQNAIETAVRSSQLLSRQHDERKRGGIFTLRADLMPVEARSHIYAAARVVLIARRGKIKKQFAGLQKQIMRRTLPRPQRIAPPMTMPTPTDLEFFNGFGGFSPDGQEYVVILDKGRTTPAPWINVVANNGFGFQVSAEGAGYSWSENSKEHQITPWSNDPVVDPPGETIYVRDMETGDVFAPTASPIRDQGTYVARHGRGYSRFEHSACDIAMDLVHYVPVDDPIKISRLTLRNLSNRERRLSVTAYAEWALGSSRGASIPFIQTEIDPDTGAMLAINPWNMAFGGRVAFLDMAGHQETWTADRREFVGRNGRLSYPAALQTDAPLSGATGSSLDPCGVLQREIRLAPGASMEIVVTLGDTESSDASRALIAKYREADLDAAMAAVKDYWNEFLGTVQVQTPDRAMNLMLNGWLLYQTLACRITARSAFYQASGAYGFRDQLQDGMALAFTKPDVTRHHLLRAAGRQFVEGDVQHWWLPHSGQGVRTRISDDRVWMSYCVATYARATGDTGILEESIPFLEGQKLLDGEHDAFFLPMQAQETGTLFEHCARGLDQCIELTGEHGLPLIGTGDWNDGMNRVGERGLGESVWLGWLFVTTVRMFSPMVEARAPERVAAWRAHADKILQALESFGWDGEWYRRGSFDDGSLLGSMESDECRIDSIAQSWAVLSGVADPRRAAKAMDSVEKYLIKPQDKIAMLFTPPFDKTHHDPGYIKGYPPGLRENGGQYSHAAMWAILAFAKLGDGDRAGSLFSLLNPINHALTTEEAERYKVEPYVVAADVYSVPPHAGRGGWTWYTGAAGWMYRAGLEGILGLRREGTSLRISPCIPHQWPGYRIKIKQGDTEYEIVVENPAHRCNGIDYAELDGSRIQTDADGCIKVPLDGKVHTLTVILGGSSLERATAAEMSETFAKVPAQ